VPNFDSFTSSKPRDLGLTSPAPIRLALCITELDFGGAERCLVELATRLARPRFEPVVYCLGPRPQADESSLAARLEGAGIEVHCLGARSSWQFVPIVRRLARLLAVQRPEILQTFLFHANVVGPLAARRSGVPHVVTGIRVAERRSRAYLWLERLAARRAERHVCVSRSVAEFSHAQGRLPTERLVVIPNGIDVDRYPARSAVDLTGLGLPPNRRAVTYVGRLDRQKGVRWLVETAPEWLAQLPNHDLLLVGKGPEQPALVALSEKLGVASRIHLSGWRSDVPEILRASNLLVLPSAWEGMPNVVLEAMASGLPVVATDVEGVRELLGPAAEAQVVPGGNSQAFSERIVAIASNPELAASLGQENRCRAEREFSLARMVAAYEGLYESLLKPGNSREGP
jgi:glycosyltransferase involved in cell wall biosynthesis